ncbi:acyltransferase family protein [Kineococcus terrestris]|uniref:acyltransferase family protein n=1 Tax=Kineococcus terrestris TaxID=2044856 RepID=UPI0034DAE0E8
MAATARLAWVDTARGAALLLVVVYHAFLFALAGGLTAGAAASAWGQLVGAAGAVRMPLFFFLSGLLAARALDRPWPVLVRGRVGTHLWLYVLWASVAYAVFSVVPYQREGAPDGPLLWAETTFWLPRNAAWYLLALALFVVAGRLLRRAATGPLLLGATAVALGTSAGAHSGVLPVPSFVWFNVATLFVFFAAGSRAGRWAPALVQRCSGTLVAGGLLAAVGAVALLAARAQLLAVPGVSLLLGAAGVVAGLAVAGRLAPTAPGRALARLGRDTLGVYVLHEVVLGCLVAVVLAVTGAARLVAAGSGAGELVSWLAVPVLVVAALVAAVALTVPLRRVRGALGAPWRRGTAPTAGAVTVLPPQRSAGGAPAPGSPGEPSGRAAGRR